jgi:hypothetical protein
VRRAVIVTLVLTAIAAGCGDGSASPEEVVSAAVSGLSKGDEQKVCAQLTPAAKRTLLKVLADDPPIVKPVQAATCEEAITKVHAQLSEPLRAVLEDGEVDEAKIDGDRAVVHITGAGADVDLQKISGQWKITGGLLDR